MATLATRLPRRVAKDATGDSTSQNILRAKYVTYRHIFTYGVYKKMWRNKINIYLHIHVTLGVFVAAIEITTHGSSDMLLTQLCCQHFHQAFPSIAFTNTI